jgi:hypothetical protein
MADKPLRLETKALFGPLPKASISPKEKAARRRLLNLNLRIVDQAAINAGLELRRYTRSILRVPASLC